MNNTPLADILVLDTHNLKTMAVGDISYYPTGFTVVNPTLEATPPGFPKVVLSVQSQSITTFNSNDVRLTQCTDPEGLIALPDGIWDLKYSFAQANINFVVKRFLRTANLEASFFNSFAQTDISTCDDALKSKDKQALDQIWYLIQEAIAAANQCSEARAMDMYRLASTKLTSFLNTKC